MHITVLVFFNFFAEWENLVGNLFGDGGKTSGFYSKIWNPGKSGKAEKPESRKAFPGKNHSSSFTERVEYVLIHLSYVHSKHLSFFDDKKSSSILSGIFFILQ